ncbi:hypothetical protein H9P43_001915 [Blastocladiella emersonii ATCC 22665]|nr:hypothetical protein H9P43_001915 [Blastocladiella emersonii ATCC 22665]
MSSSLVWMLLKSNNSFLVRRNGVEFSAEKSNLTQRNTPRFSGLVAAKPVTVRKIGGKHNKVAIRVGSVKTTITKAGNAALLKKAGNFIGKIRPDLKAVALKRISAASRKAFKA